MSSKDKKNVGFSKLSIHKLVKHSGSRISENGAVVLKNYLEGIMDEISSSAVKITHKNNEKRVSKSEIELAFDIFKGRL